ncbi:MAG: prenyltransferase/squalene oxidase repeat-containing protein [Acidobacteriaceae bacterium]
MRKIYLILAILCGLAIVAGLTFYLQTTAVLAQATTDTTQVIENGLAYLRGQQQADGGIVGFSGVSDPDTTARSVLAYVAAGEPVSEVVSEQGASMIDYIATQAISFTHDTTGTLFPGRAGLLLSALSLSRGDVMAFGGMDLVGELEGSYQAVTGAYSTTARQDFSSGQASDLNQAWSILGLSLAGEDIPEAATQYLARSQAEDGSWGAGDPDTTALALTALLASRKVELQSETIQAALLFFHSTQLDNAGWKPSWDTDPLNADSTGWILQALTSAGEDPAGEAWTKGGMNPVQALVSLQKEDGSIGGSYANTYSTAEAILGLAQRPLAGLEKSKEMHRAGVAIFSGNDSLFTECVSFTETSLSGLELLQRSGLAIETATDPNQGTAVCKIGAVGDPAKNCFGSMPEYWSYWQMGPEGWQYAVTGASQSMVVDGEVNAWNWGTGDPPALIGFQNICEGVAFVLPTATQTSLPPTETPAPSLAATSLPGSVSPSPTPTPVSGAKSGWGIYIVYASIFIVLAALVVLFVRARNR